MVRFQQFVNVSSLESMCKSPNKKIRNHAMEMLTELFKDNETILFGEFPAESLWAIKFLCLNGKSYHFIIQILTIKLLLRICLTFLFQIFPPHSRKY